MARSGSIFLFSMVMILSVFVYTSAKYQKHTKLELLKEIVGRFFGDVEGVCERPLPKIAFAVALSKVLSNVNALVLKFESVLTNEGNGYNKNTGVFTAPSAGMYLFSWHILSHSGKKAHVSLYKNNNATWSSLADDGPQGRDTGSATVILRLKKGDKVDLRTVDSGNYLHSGLSNFTGTLLYL